MSSREVKEYLSHHLVPQLLESLLTGLLYHRPDDPVSFLQSCLIRTRHLGGPEAVTWDTFIHLDRDQLRPGPPKTLSAPPPPPSVPPRTTPIPPIKSPPPFIPPLTPPIPQPPPSVLQKLPPLPPITHPAPPPSQSEPQLPSIKPKTSVLSPLTPSVSSIHHNPPQTAAEPRVLLPAPPNTPPPHTELTEDDTKRHSSEGKRTNTIQVFTGEKVGLQTNLTPDPHPPLPTVQSQLSIDSDSDMTESSGLLQEVSILPTQRPRPLIIFIIGGPGSGKGSQTERLACCFGLRAISLDDLLRKQLLNHASPSRKWEVISEMMSHGELGPQEETISELRRQLIGRREVRGFIVDGFPRDVHQALSFQEQIGSPDLVMLLLCSNETLSCRLQQRAARLGLLGDSSHTFRRRLDTFQRDVVSIRRYYRQTHLLIQVDADRDEQVVFADLSSIIREKLQLKDQSGPVGIPECSSAVRDVPFTIRSVNQ
ncbi:adenylate kinase isoenzyme 5-like [Lates calcarifer]|uniref:Adenylate kinase isoenzyme 5-like n=1 Tax=Lates calcarifer TaxID=8187 RepID=A0AAJ8B2X7_LATCA|nr:adenylate kinase isoenzyme 5-like [Lates calcarifer]